MEYSVKEEYRQTEREIKTKRYPYRRVSGHFAGSEEDPVVLALCLREVRHGGGERDKGKKVSLPAG